MNNDDKKQPFSLRHNGRWTVAGLVVIGVAFGIVFSTGFSNAMHWAGSTAFCGEFCHSMDVTYAAYKKGLHYKTASGVSAGCSDCHLLNESNGHNNPVQYAALLADKIVSASHSGIGEVLGHLNTPEKQIEKRPEMAGNVLALMRERAFSTCLGCHDLSKMENEKKPVIARMHRKMADATNPADCLACHPTAGHDYEKAREDIEKIVADAAK